MECGVYVGIENYVYGLVQSSTNELVYVGQTTNLRQRLKGHLASTVKDLRGDCHMIVFESGVDMSNEHEYFWIEYMRSLGCNLRNRRLRLKPKSVRFADTQYNKFCKTMPHLTVQMNQQGITVEQMVELSGLGFKIITIARNGGRLEPYAAYRISNVLKFGTRLLESISGNRRRNLVNGWIRHVDKAVKRIESRLAKNS